MNSKTEVPQVARPILFSAPMVRAILGGHKTQTRRIIEPQPARVWFSESEPNVQKINWKGCTYRPSCICCPYGIAGDRLWVRETWAVAKKWDGKSPGWTYGPVVGRPAVAFRADGAVRSTYGKWRPSIHMPRWASRITLEITKVRVERVQDISEEDAEAEGVDPIIAKVPTHRDAFRYLWDDINGDGEWDANPWIWVLEFERVMTHEKHVRSGAMDAGDSFQK